MFQDKGTDTSTDKPCFDTCTGAFAAENGQSARKRSANGLSVTGNGISEDSDAAGHVGPATSQPKRY